MKIGLMIGSVAISGGTYVIFEHGIRIAKAYKHQVIVLTEYEVKPSDIAWHREAHELSYMTIAEAANEQFDVVVATWWRTVYEMYRLTARQYCYFIQSVESKFYNQNELTIRKLADSTYMLGLPVITEATWIKEYLYNNYSVDAQLVKNGIRKDIYTTTGDCIMPRDPNKLRVLVEGPVDAPFKNVPRTLKLCRESNADEVWLLTSSEVRQHKLADKVFSRVSIFETAKIYRSCDIVVKLSYVEGMFGPPLEMFHCGGTAIVYAVTGHDEYIVNDYNAYVVPKDDEQKVIELINYLKQHPDALAKLKANAQVTAKSWPDWDNSAREFESALDIIMKQPFVSQKELQQRSSHFFDWYVLAETYDIKARFKIIITKIRHRLKWLKAQIVG